LKDALLLQIAIMIIIGVNVKRKTDEIRTTREEKNLELQLVK